MADETIETTVPVAEAPVQPRKPRRSRKPAVAETTLDVLRAQLNAVGALVEMQGEKLDAMTVLLEAQTLLIAKLLEAPRPAASRNNASVPPSGLAKVGKRGDSYTCACVDREGKVHGRVTINRFDTCPTCYNEAHFAARRVAA